MHSTPLLVGWECNIIVSQNLIAVVDNTFKSEMCLDKEENLSAITVKLPPKMFKSLGYTILSFSDCLGKLQY